jgi:hypothetical protein
MAFVAWDQVEQGNDDTQYASEVYRPWIEMGDWDEYDHLYTDRQDR